MLSASSVVVDAYENLKQQFESVKDTVFGQQAQTSQIGNAMALVGEFIALMNASGVNYAETDANSALPSADASS
jgi:hypothetical protein